MHNLDTHTHLCLHWNYHVSQMLEGTLGQQLYQAMSFALLILILMQ